MNIALSADRWCPALLLLLALTALWQMSRRLVFPIDRIRQLIRGEEGVVYSLSLVMVLPLYTALICIAVELTMILNVQIGVDYAASATARSAAVWVPAETTSLSDADLHLAKVRQAAVNAITPFSSGKDRQLSHRGTDEQQFMTSVEKLTSESSSKRLSFIRNKYRYAQSATTVGCNPLPGDFKNLATDEITVSVSYQMPLLTPVTRFLMGTKNDQGVYVRTIRSEVSVRGEFSRSRDRRLGWHYDSYASQSPVDIPHE